MSKCKCASNGNEFNPPEPEPAPVETIPYKRYGKILFQKVAQGPELPFVQPGSPKNVFKNYVITNISKIQNVSKFSL